MAERALGSRNRNLELAAVDWEGHAGRDVQSTLCWVSMWGEKRSLAARWDHCGKRISLPAWLENMYRECLSLGEVVALAWVPLVTPLMLVASCGGRVAKWMAPGCSFQGAPHLSSSGMRAMMAVGVCSCWALERAHLRVFLARLEDAKGS